MKILKYFLVVLLSYLLGSSNLAYYLSKRKDVDMRNEGSGNLGASNAMILMGWKASIAVGLHDILKAVLAVLLAGRICGPQRLIGAVAGVSCVIGHIFPFYLNFRGGKGFASFLGMTFALNWKLAAVIVAVVVVLTLISDHIVVGTVFAVISVPVFMCFVKHDLAMFLIIAVASVLILYKHRENFARLASGEEAGLREINQMKRES